MRLIDDEGKQRGIVTVKDAIAIAYDKGLDLIEISPDSDPPVCKIVDYGKFKYEIEKQIKINKKKQHIIHVKEIRLRPNTDDHDLLTKLNKAQKFLMNGDKLKVTVMFRGREFYNRKDIISQTTSNIQIRKPIYKDSINKYLPYKKFLSIYGSKYSWFA